MKPLKQSDVIFIDTKVLKPTLTSYTGGNIGFIPAPGSGGPPRLAPPPGGSGLSPTAGRRVSTPQQTTQTQPQADLFGDISAFAPSSQPSLPQTAQTAVSDQWGDFASATG